MRGTLHMVSEPELKHLGLIGLNAATCFNLGLHVYWPWSCVGEVGTLAQNHNEDDPIPWQCYVRPEHVSTQVSGYSLAHLRICLQIAKMIASSLFWVAPINK